MLSLASLPRLSSLGALLTAQSDGSVRYDPTSAPKLQSLGTGASAVDAFTYQITDQYGSIASATVHVTVQGRNDPPVAVPDEVVASKKVVTNIAVLKNDTDPDQGDVLTVQAFDHVSASGATISQNANGTLAYDPRGSATLQALTSGQTKTDSFSYTVIDKFGATSTTTVTVIVTGGQSVAGNQPPVANPDSVTDDKSVVRNIAVLANDTDSDGDPLALGSVAQTSSLGALLTRNADGSITYDPTASSKLQALPAGSSAVDTFTYVVADKFGATATGKVTITVTGHNDAPVAGNQLLLAYANKTASIDVVHEAHDADTGAVLSVASVQATSNLGASVSIAANGTVTYDPRSVAAFRSLAFGETAFDSFTYTITDQLGDHTTAKVTVAVVGQVAPPVAGPVSASTNEDTAISVNVLANVVDPHDGAILSIASLPATSQLGARLTVLADGSVQYDPNTSSKLEALGLGQTATDSFQYVVTNEYGARATGTVTVHLDGVNDAPIAIDHTVSKNANVLSTINVLSGDHDPDSGDVLSVVSVQATSALGATLTIASDGTVTYDPRSVAALRALARGETATDTFTYTIADEHGATATAKVTVTVVGQNDPPVAVADQASTSKTAAININVLANNSDVDHGAVLSVVAFSAKSSLGVTLILNADGSITYDPTTSAKLQKLAPGQTVTDTFTYTISDQFGARSSVQCTVTVSGGSPVAASAGTHADLQPTAQDQPIAVAYIGSVLGGEPDDAISAGEAEPTRAAPVAIEDAAAVALVAGSDVLAGNLDQLDADEVIALHGIDPAQAKSISGNHVMGPTFERAELMAALLAGGIRLGTNRKGDNGSNPAANQPGGPCPGGPVRGLLLFDAGSDQLFSADQDEGHSTSASLQALNNHPGLMRFAESGLHAPDFAFEA